MILSSTTSIFASGAVNNAVPADCKTIKIEVSKTELKRHLKAGEDCGAHLEENHSLLIK